MQRAILLALFAAISLLTPARADALDFNRDIRPILSENCFQCHGFDEKARQADLRLDIADSAYADRDGVPAIVPGHPDRSELWRRITSDDEAERMPPPDSHRSLKPEQKQMLRHWIEVGAPYARHWSFIPPTKAPLPDVSDKTWPRNEIDHFVLTRLDAEELKPAPTADLRTLVRRVALDLTGLPPSAEEVDAFVADHSDDAYEKLVDRLLASSHFGERLALDWLDAARYADTNGYSIDGGRHIWLWRDWVIDAFNRNLPYDEFLLEQLAGDLLPEPTEAQLIATGFQRNNMNTHEGGTIPEENITNYNVDRVKTLGEAVLGLTLGCAQCHDHKFDPITQRDYYQLFAYFNTLSDQGLDGNSGKNSVPVYEAKTVLQTGEEPALRQEIEKHRQALANPDAAHIERWQEDQRADLAARGTELKLHPVELLKVSTPNLGKGFDIEPPRFVRVTFSGDMLAYDVSLRLPKPGRPITGLRIVFHPDAGAPAGGRGFGTLPERAGSSSSRAGVVDDPARQAKGTFVLTSFSASAESVPGDQVNLHKLLAVKHVTASSWLPEYRPENVLDTRNENGWSPEPAEDGPAHITVNFDEPIDSAAAPFLTTQLNFGHGRSLVAARFEILAMTGADDSSPLPADIIAILQTPTETQAAGSAGGLPPRTAEQQNRLRDYYSAHSDDTRPRRIALANLEERLAVLTQKFATMIMDEAEKPRETFILRRGDYSQPTEKVAAATPAVLPPAPNGAPPNRLGLAQWVTMREHPLTARVFVNRVWQMLFGSGLVPTTADFGAQGQYPSHPALLDWLAVDFMENGWDVKRLVRQIVTSTTYRQSSHVGEFLRNSQPSVGDTRLRDLLARDPTNRLLARGPRFRLPAEFIRDSALKVSGLLVDRLGGPSVNPYTPGDLWREISHYGSTPATAQTFVQDHGEKLYRRSLYTYWKRTVPPPNMVAFDAPNRETCIVARPSTTTPLQALVLLNDVQFVEAARAFAERIIARSEHDADRLRWAFAECVSRPPTDDEFVVLTGALARERTRYAANEAAAREFLANGESPRNEIIPAPEHAAWSQIAALLLNLSETVTRN
ncbi:MAG: PSD1 and planctomycete cytochrome C domain-containing protein [Pirellulales bacterium]